MGRCILCGGKVAGNGKCTECGWDNTKNDKKYRLNVHNEKSKLFQHRDCEDNLNQENRKKRETWQQMLEIGEPETPVRKEPVFEKKKTSSRRKREAQRRQQTGTVKKRKSFLLRIIRWIIILTVVGELAGALIPELLDEAVYLLENGFSQERWESADWGAAEIPEVVQPSEVPEEIDPMKQNWNQEDAGYLEQELQMGFYQAGRDIPAGEYQLECVTESAWISWWDANGTYSEYACLYSPERQQIYEELMERSCDYKAFSGILFLKKGDVLFVEECEGTLKLAGLADEASLTQDYEPQEGLTVTLLDEPGEMLRVEEHLPSGVYDIVLKDGSGMAEVEVLLEDRSYYFNLNEDNDRVLRVPMNQGTQVWLSYSWNGAKVQLEPSY